MGEDINIYRKKTKKGKVLAEAKISKFQQAYKRSEDKINKEIRSFQGKGFLMMSKRKQNNVEITKDAIDHILNDIRERRIPISKNDIPHILNLAPMAKYEKYSKADRDGLHKKDANIQGFKYFSFTYKEQTMYFNVAHKRKKINGKNVYVDELYCITKEIKK